MSCKGEDFVTLALASGKSRWFTPIKKLYGLWLEELNFVPIPPRGLRDILSFKTVNYETKGEEEISGVRKK